MSLPAYDLSMGEQELYAESFQGDNFDNWYNSWNYEFPGTKNFDDPSMLQDNPIQIINDKILGGGLQNSVKNPIIDEYERKNYFEDQMNRLKTKAFEYFAEEDPREKKVKKQKHEDIIRQQKKEILHLRSKIQDRSRTMDILRDENSKLQAKVSTLIFKLEQKEINFNENTAKILVAQEQMKKMNNIKGMENDLKSKEIQFEQTVRDHTEYYNIKLKKLQQKEEKLDDMWKEYQQVQTESVKRLKADFDNRVTKVKALEAEYIAKLIKMKDLEKDFYIRSQDLKKHVISMKKKDLKLKQQLKSFEYVQDATNNITQTLLQNNNDLFINSNQRDPNLDGIRNVDDVLNKVETADQKTVWDAENIAQLDVLEENQDLFNREVNFDKARNHKYQMYLDNMFEGDANLHDISHL